MAAKERLLFLYMVPATGHQKAAEAVMKSVSYMDPRIECVGMDAASHAYPLISKVFNRMYLRMLKTAPAIWDYLYDNPDVEEATRDAREFLTLISSFRMKRLLQRVHPMAVVCTQAAPAIAMAAEKRRGSLKVPLIAVVTDFGVHSYWIHPEVDLYLVGHDDVKKRLVERGISAQRIAVTGIPIMPKFGETTDPFEVRARMKLNPHKKTVLVMGGSHGLGALDELVSALLTVPVPFQAIVICGRNRGLYRKIGRLTASNRDFLVLPYVRDLSTVMAAADVLITKPGGLTCSEALAKQLPMILTNPIPGQEERNVDFLTRHRVALHARTPEDVIHDLSDLFKHPKKIATMRQHAKLISRPHSAWEAARLIFDLARNRRGFGEGDSPGSGPSGARWRSA